MDDGWEGRVKSGAVSSGRGYLHRRSRRYEYRLKIHGIGVAFEVEIGRGSDVGEKSSRPCGSGRRRLCMRS